MKLSRKIRNSFKRAVIRAIRARQQRVAAEVAAYLINENKDFRNCSHADLTRAILSKKEIKFNQISAYS